MAKRPLDDNDNNDDTPVIKKRRPESAVHGQESPIGTNCFVAKLSTPEFAEKMRKRNENPALAKFVQRMREASTTTKSQPSRSPVATLPTLAEVPISMNSDFVRDNFMVNVPPNIESNDEEQIELPSYSGEDDVVLVNPYEDEEKEKDDKDEEIDHPSRPKVMTTSELILILLLKQRKNNTTNRDVEQEVQIINDYTYGTCCSGSTSKRILFSDYDTLISKVPNAFCPKLLKYFYASCGQLIGPVSGKINQAMCKPSSMCNPPCTISPSQEINQSQDSFRYFCVIPIRVWLQHQVPLLYSKMKKNLSQSTSKVLHDLFSCEKYRQLVKPKKPGTETLTLTLTWDGVAYTDDQKSLWPVAAYINELPYTDRINNPMLLALHAGETKPKSDIMLEPIVDELVALNNEPMSIKVDGTEKLFYVRLLLIVADAPARALILNCNQYTSTKGCHICEFQGEYNDDFNAVKFQPKQKADKSLILNYELRNDEEWRQIANSNSGKQLVHEVKGVKGPCQLMKLDYIDLPTLCPSEIMHSQYLGTVKSIIERWLGKDVKNNAWYKKMNMDEKKLVNKHCMTNDNITELNKRLKSIKFPENVLKTMPQLGLARGHKSLEYEILLFFGWICFEGLIEDKRFNNFKQLAYILSGLSSRYIFPSDLRRIETEITTFFDQFDKAYSANEAFMWKINVHFICHLIDMVRWYGPLPVQSAYFTENTMGLIARPVKTGTRVPQQVMKKVNTFQSVVSTCCTDNMLNSCSELFLKNLFTFLPKLCPAPKAGFKSYTNCNNLTSEELKLLQCSQSDVKSMKRFRVDGRIICTKEYNKKKASTTNNHFIKTKKGKYYKITNIIQIQSTSKVVLIGKEALKCKKVPLRDEDTKYPVFFFLCSYIF